MAPTIKIEAGSLRATLTNIYGIKEEAFDKAARMALERAGGVLKAHLLQNVTHTDHTLRALAAMGHPYARRHGSIQVHQERPYIVHKQSGRLARSVDGSMQGTGKGQRYRVGFDYKSVPYARYVVQGTRIMLPRDVVMQTAQQPDTRKEMMRAIITVMGRELRTKARIRFA